MKPSNSKIKFKSRFFELYKKSLNISSVATIAILLSSCSGNIGSLLTGDSKSSTSSSSTYKAAVITDQTNPSKIQFNNYFQQLKYDQRLTKSTLMVKNAKRKELKAQKGSTFNSTAPTNCYVPKNASSPTCNPDQFLLSLKNDGVARDITIWVYPNEMNFYANADQGLDDFADNGGGSNGSSYIVTSFKVKASSPNVNQIVASVKSQISDIIAGINPNNISVAVTYYPTEGVYPVTDYNRGVRIKVTVKCGLSVGGECFLKSGAEKYVNIEQILWVGASGVDQVIPVTFKLDADPTIAQQPLPVETFAAVPKEYEVLSIPSSINFNDISLPSLNIADLISDDELDNYMAVNNLSGIIKEKIKIAPATAGNPNMVITPSSLTPKFSYVQPTGSNGAKLKINGLVVNSNELIVNVKLKLEYDNGVSNPKSRFLLPLVLRFFKPVNTIQKDGPNEIFPTKQVIASNNPNKFDNIIFNDVIKYDGACVSNHPLKVLREGETHQLVSGIPLKLTCTKDNGDEVLSSDPTFLSFFTNSQTAPNFGVSTGTKNVTVNINSSVASSNCKTITFDLAFTSIDPVLCPGESHFTQYEVNAHFKIDLIGYVPVQPIAVNIDSTDFQVKILSSQIPNLTSSSSVSARYRRISLKQAIIDKLSQDFNVSSITSDISAFNSLPVESEGVPSNNGNFGEKFIFKVYGVNGTTSDKCSTTYPAPCLVLDWQDGNNIVDLNNLPYSGLDISDAFSLNLFQTPTRNQNAETYGKVLNHTGPEDAAPIDEALLDDLKFLVKDSSGQTYEVTFTAPILKVENK